MKCLERGIWFRRLTILANVLAGIILCDWDSERAYSANGKFAEYLERYVSYWRSWNGYMIAPIGHEGGNLAAMRLREQHD
jgi:hypothetical protein